MEKYIPPVFIISLPNSPRRKVIEDRFNALNIPFEFFDAIYGKELSEEEISGVDREYSMSRFATKKPLTLGEIGCAMSHIKLYEHIVKNNLQEAIIFEDDAIISQEFLKILSAVLDKIPSRREIIFFDHGKGKSWLFKRSLPGGYKLVRYRYPSKNSKRCIFMADAYLLTLSGAKKLLDKAYPIRMAADYLTGAIHMTKINAYGVEPPCVFRGIDSEIDQIESRKI